MSKDITKQHITDSFNALFRKYPLEKITVNMIIENAGVSKSTFYRYFLDKFDVMNYNYKRVLDEIFCAQCLQKLGGSVQQHFILHRQRYRQNKKRVLISWRQFV